MNIRAYEGVNIRGYEGIHIWSARLCKYSEFDYILVPRYARAPDIHVINVPRIYSRWRNPTTAIAGEG